MLEKYEKMQLEMIENLNRQVVASQHTAICEKLSVFKDELATTLIEDELLGLLVKIDEETEKLEKRKNKIQKKVEER